MYLNGYLNRYLDIDYKLIGLCILSFMLLEHCQYSAMANIPFLGLHNLIQMEFTVTYTGPLASCTSAHMLHVEGILEVTYEDDDGAAVRSRFATVLRTSLTGQISVVTVSLMS